MKERKKVAGNFSIFICAAKKRVNACSMVQNMRADKEIDEILRCALTQKVEPDTKLQQKVLGKWKENHEMKFNKKWQVAAVTAACVLVAAVPVTAAVRYLSADKVAEELNYGKLAEAFKGKDAITVNESQTVGGYIVTLMGVTSGRNLEQTEWNPDCESDGTYLIVSVEKEDGTPMPNPHKDDDAGSFTVEPFIKGYSPLKVNPLYADGNFATWDVIDGVQYQLYAVSNLECFADHPIYVCVTDSIVYNTDMYCYNEETSEITRNESYKGVNALFEIQLDASKADPVKAEEYLKQFEEFGSADDTQAEEADEWQPPQEYVDFIKSGKWKEHIKDAELKVGPTEVKRDEKADCPYTLPIDIQTEDGGSSSGTLYFYDSDFIDGIAVQTLTCGGDGIYYEEINVAEKADDGTVTIKVYTRKLSKQEVKENGLT